MCGIIGVWGAPNASRYAYAGLHLLQHRGQENCGIVSGSRRKLYSQHGEGIVNDVYSDANLKRLRGNAAIGHVKYTTQGESSIGNAQPFVFETLDGHVALAHNGEFANQKSEKRRLMKDGAIFTTSSDTEIVEHRLVRSKERTLKDKLKETFEPLSPAYAITILTKNELIGIRDPAGVRPLVIGELPNGGIALASETTAFDAIDANYVGEVAPGEMISVSNSGLKREQLLGPMEKLPCIFEHIYFGRPDSFQFGCDVTNSILRQQWGAQLYREYPVNADFVTSVPDSSNDAALGYSKESRRRGNDIPFDFGFTRSHYIGKSFIYPTQALRDAAADRKNNPNRSVWEGKIGVIVEDSIVRATTTKRQVKKARKVGAKEIHVRIAAPPIKDICYQGINIPTKRELVFNRLGSIEKIRKYIGADSLEYISLDGLLSNPHLTKGHCTHCFDSIVKIPKR